MARFLAFLATLLSLALASHGAQAQGSSVLPAPVSHYHLGNGSLFDATYLIDIRQGSPLSALANRLSEGGFETATGSRVDFRHWYASRWTELSLTWMTQLSPNIGVIHGFSTGERGQKYTIAPALRLGVMMQAPTGRNAFIAFRATTTLGGELRESPCVANYGDIGGVQTVNCRLAATPLPPSQTLNHLLQTKPPDRNQMMLLFNWSF